MFGIHDTEKNTTPSLRSADSNTMGMIRAKLSLMIPIIAACCLVALRQINKTTTPMMGKTVIPGKSI